MYLLKRLKKLFRKTCIFSCNSLKYCCQHTSLHGFHYTTSEASKFIKILWAAMCIASGIFCYYLISLQLTRYNQNRVATTIATTAYPIWKLHFPAVTVCNFNSVYRENMMPFVDLLTSHNIEKQLIMDFFGNLSSLIIRNEIKIRTGNEKYAKIVQILDTYGYDTNVLMKKVAHPCEKMFQSCVWMGVEYPCKDVMKLVTTSIGYCCSFNYNAALSMQHENIDRYSLGVGSFYGLLLHMDMGQDQYVPSTNRIPIIYVMLHEKYDYPMMNLHGITLQYGFDLRVTMQPEVIITDEDVRGVKVNQRDCLFDDEKRSTWSVQYSLVSCTQEYLAESVVTVCGCLPFYLPYSGNKVRYCTILDVECLGRNRVKYTNMANEKILYKDDETDEEKDPTVCYPECDELFYGNNVDRRNKPEEQNFTVIQAYYRSIRAVKMKRSIYLSWDTILASIGGFFGFCLGGSMLSIVEVIYLFVQGFFRPTKEGKNKAVVGSMPRLHINELNVYQIYHKKSGKKNNITFITLPNVQGKLRIEKVF